MTGTKLRSAVDKRYGGLAPEKELPLSPVIELMLAHRSVRNYDGRPLAEGMLEAIIAAGQSAATSSNMQTCSVVAVTDPAVRRELSQLAGQPFMVDVPLILCFIADLSRPTRVGKTLEADLWAIPLLDNFLASAIDCAIYAQNMALAAESLGLGTCYIGNLRNSPDRVAELLKLPSRAVGVFGLCIGHEKQALTEVRPRLPQGVILHHGTYDASNEAGEIARYDDVFEAHELGQGRPRLRWTERHLARFASVDYLAGREKLREQLAALDLPLD